MKLRTPPILLAFALSASILADSPASRSQPAPGGALAARLRAAVEGSSLPARELGVSVIDVGTGAVLFSHNPTTPLNPASNAKLVTAAAALAGLHPEYRWQTTVHGRIENGAIAGPVFIKGYGDPTLDTAGLLALAHELRVNGVRRIDGGVVADDTFFDRAYMPPAFEQKPDEDAPFRATVSALSVEESTVVFQAVPGAAEGAPARVTVDPPGAVAVTNEAVTGTTTALRIGMRFDEQGIARARVWGTVASGVRGVKYRKRIENPTQVAAYAFQDALRSVGIRVAEAVAVRAMPPGMPLLASRTSPPLSSVLAELGKNSDNFFAEMVFKTIGAEVEGRPGTWARAATAVERLVVPFGIPTGSLRISNGSGLYDANRISTGQMTTLLRSVYLDPTIAHEFVAQLAIAGADGTLRSRLREAPVARVIRAKTGTLDDVISLSGYVLPPPGRSAVAFSVIANHANGRQGNARTLSDTVALEIARALYGH